MPLVAALAWVVASSLKGTVLIGLVVILRHFLQVASAARLRYALWLPVLLGLLCPIGLPVPIAGFGDFAASSSFSPRVEPTWRESTPRASTAHADADRNRAMQPSTPRPYPPARAAYSAALGWIAVVWMCGAATLSFVYLGHLLKYWRIRRGANPVDAAIADAIERCRTELRLRRKVFALESAEIDSPAIFGWWRPKLLLPLGLQRRIGSTALRHVILHELAHVKEHDVFVNWLGAATQIAALVQPRRVARDAVHAPGHGACVRCARAASPLRR